VSTGLASYLINNDDSNITAKEIAVIKKFLALNLLGDALYVDGAEYWGFCDITKTKGDVMSVNFPVIFD
jgi:hypothetical protein